MTNNAAISRFLDAARERLQAPVREYYSAVNSADPATPRGRIAITQAAVNLRTSMQKVLREQQIAAAVLGGEGDLSQQARAVLLQVQREQLLYMNNFIAEIPNLSSDAAIARAGSYTPAVGQTMTRVAVLALPPLPVQPQSRLLKCRGFCKCHLDIERIGPADFDVTWIMNPTAEHCEDCERLAIRWRPLRIRDGVIVGMKQVTPHEEALARAAIAVALKGAA